jgi:hypothetical protein
MRQAKVTPNEDLTVAASGSKAYTIPKEVIFYAVIQ